MCHTETRYHAEHIRIQMTIFMNAQLLIQCKATILVTPMCFFVPFQRPLHTELWWINNLMRNIWIFYTKTIQTSSDASLRQLWHYICTMWLVDAFVWCESSERTTYLHNKDISLFPCIIFAFSVGKKVSKKYIDMWINHMKKRPCV